MRNFAMNRLTSSSRSFVTETPLHDAPSHSVCSSIAADVADERVHAGQPVLVLIHDQHVITSHAETGKVLTEHHIDPTKDYQRPVTREPS